MIKQIISGDQTGADRAALDVAIKLNIPHGGWVPKGRLAEDGPIHPKYQLKEMPSDSYPASERISESALKYPTHVSKKFLPGSHAALKRWLSQWPRV